MPLKGEHRPQKLRASSRVVPPKPQLKLHKLLELSRSATLFKYPDGEIDVQMVCYTCFGAKFRTGPDHFVKNAIDAEGILYGKVTSEWRNLRKTQYGRSEENEMK